MKMFVLTAAVSALVPRTHCLVIVCWTKKSNPSDGNQHISARQADYDNFAIHAKRVSFLEIFGGTMFSELATGAEK
jgi:hypothetical protein